MKAVDDKDLRQILRLFQIVEQVVALGVDVRRGVVGNLTRRVAKTNPFVEDGGSNPNRPAIGVIRFGAPETHVVSFPGIVSDRLLKRQILSVARIGTSC